MKLVIGLVATAVLLYVVIVGIVFFAQRKLQYFPTHRELHGKEKTLYSEWKSADGEFLGYVHRPEGTAKGAILFFHGNGGEAMDRGWLILLAPKDYILFLAEYPGYGAKAGDPTEATIFAAAEKQVTEAAMASKDLTVLGESLGSGVASYVAARQGVTRLILISPFSSALDVAKKAYGFLPVSLLLKDKFESWKYLKAANHVPLQIFHGEIDTIVPFSLGEKLFDGFGGKKELFRIPEANHNDIVEFLLRPPASSAFLRFLAS